MSLSSPLHVLLLNYQASNLSNASSLLYHALLSLPSPSSAVNWCGFYVLDPLDSSRLILGPFQGHVACQTIALGKGVCGTAAKEATTQVVPNVEKFPGHIACDAASKSEIVVPILKGQRVRLLSLSGNRCKETTLTIA
jgi:L-methionine (R)-S-oxide reductase